MVKAAAVLLAICSIGFLFKHKATFKDTTGAKIVNEKSPNRLIHLADGSIVIINSGSKLKYPSSFNGLTNREVFLVGEAYFDIKHDPSHPFIVHVGHLKTTVLGTAFNIKALPGDMNVSVTVTRGKVKVSNNDQTLGIILPDHQLTFNIQKGASTLKRVQSDAYLAWKNKDLLFDDVTVAEACNILEERFKVKIKYSDSLIKTNRFTTTFLRSESIDEILKSICEFNNANYVYNQGMRTVVISTIKK